MCVNHKDSIMVALYPINRHKTHQVIIGNIPVGGGAPIVVQSMTNTDTSDIEATTKQVIELSEAGSEIVRITVNNEAAAKAVPFIKENIGKRGYTTPLVGCFHYNGHRLLTQFPDCAKALDKYRINPGNVGFGEKRDRQFDVMVERAIEYNKPIRIGVNWGSLDQDLATELMNDNSASLSPKSADEIMREALVVSTLKSAKRAEELGLPANRIVISTKVSRIQDLIAVYMELARRSNYCLHLGLTEAGIGSKGIVATASALGILLHQGIGDTIRASITPIPGDSRIQEVTICQEVLQTLGLRSFLPLVSSCPGCGRTTSTFFQELAEKIQNFIRVQIVEWKKSYPGVENMNVAVMGCIVNGPGESKHADIGISLPGSGEDPIAPVFIDGKKTYTLRGGNIAEEFQNILTEYVVKKYAKNI